MPTLHISSSGETRLVECSTGQTLGAVISASDLPLEQPCAGRGTCGKCKVIAQGALGDWDGVEEKYLLPAERAANIRLACRARIVGDVHVTLTPAVVYSNKVFVHSNEFRTNDDSLGLAIDLGSTTVAAFLVSLKTAAVYAGAAALNQQTLFGADIVSRLAAAETESVKLSALAQASIYQALGALRLGKHVRERIERVVIVGNSAMHHLLMQYPVTTLAALPFQPHSCAAIPDAGGFFGPLFPMRARVSLPPLIGGFVGSDTTACLGYFGFDRKSGPMLAVDLGTNGEVMVTDGAEIRVASTAAGPAFEGMNISCGTRAVDGAIVDARLEENGLHLTTIGNHKAVGITGSGLISLVYALRCAGVVDASGRFAARHDWIPIREGSGGIREAEISDRVRVTQGDIRELQKAKAAIRVAADLLLERLGLDAMDLKRVILTGSFGSQVYMDAVLGLGLIPPVARERIELIPNGAGLGAALFLQDAGFQLAERLATRAQHVELDLDPEFNRRFVEASSLTAQPNRAPQSLG